MRVSFNQVLILGLVILLLFGDLFFLKKKVLYFFSELKDK